MFYARERELTDLKAQLDKKEKAAVLIYGKRRVGKSTLIGEAVKSYQGIVVNHLCIRSSYQGNLDFLCRSISSALGIPQPSFTNLLDIFGFLGKMERRFLIILDEYQYFKESLPEAQVDSLMQVVIDTLPKNVKLILCGSYITVMKELLQQENPLFGRFTSVIHLHEMDYLDASLFYHGSSTREKLEFYAVFGGSPYVLSQLDSNESLEDNIKKLLLPQDGLLRIHLENVMLNEVKKNYDIRIISSIGNGKKRYSDLSNALNLGSDGLLDKQLKILLDMEVLSKTSPINRAEGRKKAFYEIKDNLMRFYFLYIFGNNEIISRLGEDAFYENYVRRNIRTFISFRLETIVLDYFSRMVKSGKTKDVLNIGTYWFDNPQSHENGQFDCVLEKKDGYDFYEVKYYENPMAEKECRQEEMQVRSIPGLKARKIGFVCSSGFDFTDEQYNLINGDDLYSLTGNLN